MKFHELFVYMDLIRFVLNDVTVGLCSIKRSTTGYVFHMRILVEAPLSYFTVHIIQKDIFIY